MILLGLRGDMWGHVCLAGCCDLTLGKGPGLMMTVWLAEGLLQCSGVWERSWAS